MLLSLILLRSSMHTGVYIYTACSLRVDCSYLIYNSWLEQYFSLTPNQPAVLSAIVYKPIQPKRTCCMHVFFPQRIATLNSLMNPFWRSVTSSEARLCEPRLTFGPPPLLLSLPRVPGNELGCSFLAIAAFDVRDRRNWVWLCKGTSLRAWL